MKNLTKRVNFITVHKLTGDLQTVVGLTNISGLLFVCYYSTKFNLDKYKLNLVHTDPIQNFRKFHKIVKL